MRALESSILCDPSVQALLRLAGNNFSVVADIASAFHKPCGGACEEDGPSFLEAELATRRQMPKNRHFQLACRCAGDLVVRPSGRLTVNLPLGSCTSNFARVTRIYTPGCSANASVCEARMQTLDARVAKCYNTRMAWSLPWARVREHHFSDFSGWTQQPVLGTPGGDLVRRIAMPRAEDTTLMSRVPYP